MTVPEPLREQLCSPDEEARYQAVQALRAHGAAALPLLAAGLGDRSWRVRKAALDIVVAVPGPQMIPLLLEGLRDEENAGRRNSCMEALIRLGAEAVPFLGPLVRDPDADFRKFIVDALGSIDDPVVDGLLREAFEDADENVSAAAAEYLGRRRVREAVPALLRRLGEGGVWLKFGCLRALGEIGDDAAAPAVISLLREPGLSKAAMEALGRVGGESALPHLLDGLFCRDRGMRKATAVAALQVVQRLRERGGDLAVLREGVRRNADQDFLRFLRELLTQEDPAPRMAAAVLLGMAPGPETVDMIVAGMPEATEQEQELFARVLAELPDESLPLLFPKLQHPGPVVRFRVAQVLGQRRCRAAVPGLLGLLADETGHVRAAAATALGAIGDPAAAAPLLALLGDSFEDVREVGREAIVHLGAHSPETRELVLVLLEPHLAAAEEELAASVIRIVGRLGARQLSGRLGAALRDDRGDVRRAAAEALGMIGGPEAVQALRFALTDEDVSVRREVVLRLGQTRDPAAVALLLPMLQDEDLWVRVRTVQALAGFDDAAAGRALLAAAREDAPGPKRLAAIRALGQSRAPGSLGVLTELAAAPDRERRMAAVEALGQVGDPAAVDVLLPLLGDAEWGLRCAAVKSLAPFLAEGRVRAALEEAVRADADPLVRTTALGLLGRAGSPG
jgi:HEAT repeat protein